MKYLSLFSGIGGFEIGIENAFHNRELADSKSLLSNRDKPDSPDTSGRRSSATCIGYSEIDPYADAIYKYNFGGHNYGDITTINPTELPDFDLLTAGFPCQSFSIAGKRLGFSDTRGTLFFDIVRILKEKQPRHFILENVKGLLSHDSGNTFRTIITSLAELGYAVEWQVLNAKDFGVPQNRERVFIVGHLGGFGGRQVFPIRGNDTKDNGQPVSNAITANYWKGIDNHGSRSHISEVRTDQPDTPQGGNQPDSSNRIRRTSYTDGMRIRRLTPTECERLMGYPDDWTKYGRYEVEPGKTYPDWQLRVDRKGDWYERREMSDTRRYKACGNGVVSNVVEEVIRRLYV